MQKTTLVWFRRNLRLTDNAALSAAVRRGLPLAGVFVQDAANPRQAAFLRASAAELHRELAQRGIPLFIVQDAAETAVLQLTAGLNASAAVADEGCMPDEAARDNRIWRLLDAHGCAFERVNDGAVFAKAEIMDEHGRPYFEFAPYRQAWLREFARRFADWRPSESLPAGFQTASGTVLPFPSEPVPQDLPQQQGGEAAGRRRWAQFAADIGNYPLTGGFPAKKGTGRVGAYLAAGCLSPRELAQAAAERGAAQWLDNLIRRDFFRQIMFHRPEAVAEPLRPEYRGIRWQDNPDNAERWRQGQTGFPLIDAAMRSLHVSGWLHPALRAAAAAFFCRILLADWRHGAAWFAQCLTDYDPASNTGNWQVAAGVAELAPKRAANPILQSQRLDPDGTFIRRHVPELAHLPKDIIHAPWLARASVDTHGYPPPMADYMRQGAAYAALFGRGA